MTSPNHALQQAVIGKPQQWQQDAWLFYDTVGELRFGVGWIANGMSRVNLVTAMPPLGPGDEPTPIDLDDPRTNATQRRAIELVSMIADGPAGQGQLLAAFGTHLSVAGIAWLVIEPATDDPEDDVLKRWDVYATEELRQQQDRIEVRTGEKSWRTLHPNAIVVRVWRRHPRESWRPDAPTRSVLTVLNEIDLLTKHIQASAQSRLAGAGILAIPSEATFPPGQGGQSTTGADSQHENLTAPEDTFVETLIDAMTVPLADRSSAASVVPLVIKVPGELVDKITHISFSTPFDAQVLALIENAVKRLALGLDIPPEVLTGMTDANHWSAWQIAEEAITLHLEPLSETVTNALTLGYLRPALEAEGYPLDEIAEVMVWHDTSDLRTRPDLTASAIQAYDRQELSAEAMLREMGLSVADMPDEAEKRERILLQVARSLPTSAPAILRELGYLTGPLDVQPNEVILTEDIPPPPATEAHGPPERQDETVISAALAAACDVIVRRALERAGNRLRSAAGRKTQGGAAAIACDDITRLHLTIDATEHADLATLLDGAWTMVPEIAERYGCDTEALVATLDAYARALLSTGQEHRYGRLAVALGA